MYSALQSRHQETMPLHQLDKFPTSRRKSKLCKRTYKESMLESKRRWLRYCDIYFTDSSYHDHLLIGNQSLKFDIIDVMYFRRTPKYHHLFFMLATKNWNQMKMKMMVMVSNNSLKIIYNRKTKI